MESAQTTNDANHSSMTLGPIKPDESREVTFHPLNFPSPKRIYTANTAFWKVGQSEVTFYFAQFSCSSEQSLQGAIGIQMTLQVIQDFLRSADGSFQERLGYLKTLFGEFQPCPLEAIRTLSYVEIHRSQSVRAFISEYGAVLDFYRFPMQSPSENPEIDAILRIECNPALLDLFVECCKEVKISALKFVNAKGG